MLIYRNGNGTDPVYTHTVAAPTTSHTESNPGAGVYTAKVVAVSFNGKAGDEASAGPLTVGIPGKPDAPTATGAIGNLTLTWQKNATDPNPDNTIYFAKARLLPAHDPCQSMRGDESDGWLGRSGERLLLPARHEAGQCGCGACMCSCKPTEPWAAQPQIYSAADDALVTGPVSLAGATGSGTAQSPFEKTISLPFGKYKVRARKGPRFFRTACMAMQQRRILQSQEQSPSCITAILLVWLNGLLRPGLSAVPSKRHCPR